MVNIKEVADFVSITHKTSSRLLNIKQVADY